MKDELIQIELEDVYVMHQNNNYKWREAWEEAYSSVAARWSPSQKKIDEPNEI